MSLTYFGKMENQARAGKIARQMMKDLAISDVESIVAEHLERLELEKLYEAIDADYPAVRKALFDHPCELDDEHSSLQGIIQTAWFNLGFAAALQLLGEEARARSLMLTPKQYRKMSSEVKAAIK